MKKVISVVALALSLSIMSSGCLMTMGSGSKSKKNTASEEFKEYSDAVKKESKSIFDAKLANEKQLDKLRKHSGVEEGLGEFDDAVYYQFSRGSVKELDLESKKADGDDMENIFFFRATDGDDAIVAINIFQFSDDDIAEDYYDEQCDVWSMSTIGFDEPVHMDDKDVGMEYGKDYYAGIAASSVYDQAQSVFLKLDGDTVIMAFYYGTYEDDYLEDYFKLLEELDYCDMEKVMKES